MTPSPSAAYDSASYHCRTPDNPGLWTQVQGNGRQHEKGGGHFVMVQEGPSSPAQSRDDEEHNLPRTGVACMTFFIVPTLRNRRMRCHLQQL